MRKWTIAALIAMAAIAVAALWKVNVISAGVQVLPAHRPPATAAPRGSSSAPAPPSVTPAGPNRAWRPAFAARFSGARLDTSVWATCYPWQDGPAGCTNFGNTEYEWYLPGQDRVSGGVLHLAAQRVPTPGMTANGAPKEYSCRSGMVTTYPGFRFQYGYVQVVAQIPNGPGLWPALWLAAANQEWPPEIDMLEHWSSDPWSRVSLHPSGAIDNFSYFAKPVTADLSVGWHTFGLSWTASKLIWFIDGKAVLSLTNNVPHQPMYLIANLAQASVPQPAGAQCSGTMLIRSVEVWRP